MNGKLIIKATVIGVLTAFALIIASLLFIVFFASHLSNFVFEDYIFVVVLLGLFSVAIYAYKKAESKKILHAVAVYVLSVFASIFSVGLILLILFLLFRLYCRIYGCGFFSF